ncbi:MAG TPA: UDP-N-acetylmuramate--L-alanine ligase [Alphaproteobacteria bacterium]|nr:UDP-N-acetylmuramate--L-alanine ligase [Alphaproteobacteria bacterium]
MQQLPWPVGTIHFIGIGGIGMSGIAELMHHLGYRVQGSDLSDGYNQARLRKLGITCHTGHRKENLDGATVVVISSAVKESNPELAAARAAHIPVIKRAEMLAELMRFKWTVAVAGTHGKTTTTSLVSTLLHGANLDPTVVNGGIINSIGTNSRVGRGQWMVVESDESDGSFLKLPTTVGIITNIDPEHMEHYGSFDAVREAYQQFVLNLPFYGFAVCCTDHPEVRALTDKITERKIITYGENKDAMVQCFNASANGMIQKFSLSLAPDLVLEDLELPMVGKHNVLNATAAIIVAHELGATPTQIRAALAEFGGVKRRFTKTGEANGVTIIDDYGHHPVEIAAVLQAARQAADKNKVIAVIQPHRYSRLHDLFNEFASCTGDADSVIISDVYAAGEDPIAGADRDGLVAAMQKAGHKDVSALPAPEKLAEMIAAKAKPGDYVICLGAGSITTWAAELPEQLKGISKAA